MTQESLRKLRTFCDKLGAYQDKCKATVDQMLEDFRRKQEEKEKEKKN